MFRLMIASVLACALSALAIAPAAAADRPLIVRVEQGRLAAQPAAKLLLAKAAEAGRIGAIVGLDLALTHEDELTPAQIKAQARRLDRAQNALIARARIGASAHVKKYKYAPYLALRATRAQLARLLADPAVVSISEDIALTLQLAESTEIIQAPTLWRQERIKGDGQVVAILDSGVDYGHPMLNGKIVAGACFSQNLCPNGAGPSHEFGSGRNCPPSLRQCEHGTEVASIAVGNSAALRGVAPLAKIIAIKILSRFDTAAECAPLPRPCVKPLNSDLDSALEHVFDLRGTHDIAAVTLSLAENTLYGAGCDLNFPHTSMHVGNLRAAGIATIVATGNNSGNGGLPYPACLEDVIAVGATTDTDRVWEGSNYSHDVKLMAPGKNITAAAPPGSPCLAPGAKHCTDSGTSLAVPHVAGAFALMRQADPDASIDKILNALSCTGTEVSRRQLHRPRIDVLKAFRELVTADEAITFKFVHPTDGEGWTKHLGVWQQAAGKFSATAWQSFSNWVMASREYCSSSFRVIAVMKRIYPDAGGGGSAGLLVASNIAVVGKTVAVSGYLLEYDVDITIKVSRLDNFALSGAVGIGGVKTGVCSKAINHIPIEQHSLKIVVKDDSYSFFLNGEPVCARPIRERIFAPPAHIAFVASGPGSSSPGHGLEVDRLNITPLP